MSGRRELAIATTIDDRWVPHFATCAASVAASRGPERIRFLMLQGAGLSDASVRALGDFVRELDMEFDAISIPPDVDASMPPTSAVFSPLVWYRLLLPELLADRDRVLFLDADTIVLQSLVPLFDIDLGKHLFAAVAVTARPEHKARLGVDPVNPVFNAGVMMMNLDIMRAEDFGPRTIALGHERNADFVYNEQDAMTVMAEGRWDQLHPKWNALSYLWLKPKGADPTYPELDQAVARLSPAIVHFEGFQTVKPWFYRSIHPLRFLYRDYRAQTPWPLQELERKSAAGAVLRRLPIRLQYLISRAKIRLAERSARRRPA